MIPQPVHANPCENNAATRSVHLAYEAKLRPLNSFVRFDQATPPELLPLFRKSTKTYRSKAQRRPSDQAIRNWRYRQRYFPR